MHATRVPEEKEHCYEERWGSELVLLEHGSVAWVLDRGSLTPTRGSVVKYRGGLAMVSILVSSSWAW